MKQLPLFSPRKSSDIERADEAASLHTMSEPELDTEAEFEPDSDDDPECCCVPGTAVTSSSCFGSSFIAGGAFGLGFG
jgi:hypothetical protein